MISVDNPVAASILAAERVPQDSQSSLHLSANLELNRKQSLDFFKGLVEPRRLLGHTDIESNVRVEK